MSKTNPRTKIIQQFGIFFLKNPPPKKKELRYYATTCCNYAGSVEKWIRSNALSFAFNKLAKTF